jgi:tetratricopeptide (TPR) repeat protein
MIPPMIGTGWHVASFYETPTRKTARVAGLFPDTPRVWEKLGWCHYSKGDYERAIEYAKRELKHEAPQVRSGAYQLLGMTELRRGNADRALELLHEAIEIDPKSALGKYRLALAYEELGRTREAIPHFETAVEAAPGHNPTLNRLASVYRRMGRSDDARAMYDKACTNNRYEVAAVMALAELDIETGTPASYRAAERRLLDLLDWMSENTEAWTNLGAVRAALGRPGEAIQAYQKALATNPGHVTAALNLAQLYNRDGDAGRARPLFERAVAGGLESVDQATVVHDFFISQGNADQSVTLWKEVSKLSPESIAAREFLAWSFALSGDLQQAGAACDALTGEAPASPLVLATLTYIDLSAQRYETATARAAALGNTGDGGVDARKRLLGALDRFDQSRPNIPWTFCLATQLLIADGNLRGANLSVRLCEARCTDSPCREQVHDLQSQIRNVTTPADQPESASPQSGLWPQPNCGFRIADCGLKRHSRG